MRELQVSDWTLSTESGAQSPALPSHRAAKFKARSPSNSGRGTSASTPAQTSPHGLKKLTDSASPSGAGRRERTWRAGRGARFPQTAREARAQPALQGTKAAGVSEFVRSFVRAERGGARPPRRAGYRETSKPGLALAVAVAAASLAVSPSAAPRRRPGPGRSRAGQGRTPSPRPEERLGPEPRLGRAASVRH